MNKFKAFNKGSANGTVSPVVTRHETGGRLYDKRKQVTWRKGVSMLLSFLGAILLLVGSLMCYRWLHEANYIEVIGRSLSAELREVITQFSGSSTSSRNWKLYVEYEYWVGGEYFTSDSVASRRPSSLIIAAGQPPSPYLQSLLQHYQTGNQIKVYASPERPERAVLIRFGPIGFWLILAGGIALGVAAAVRSRFV
jgi:hypothetical protein